MKAKKYWILVTMLGVCASIIWAVDKTESKTSPQVTLAYDERDTLKGLQGVGVLVEYIVPEVEKYGLTRQQLQTDVELRLRQNSIKVLSKQERLSTPGQPFLYVNVNIGIFEDCQLAAFNILLELQQNVFLTRDTTKLCYGATWCKGTLGRRGLGKIETIREEVKDIIDIFINDYLAANPKEQPAPVEEKDKKPKDN